MVHTPGYNNKFNIIISVVYRILYCLHHISVVV